MYGFSAKSTIAPLNIPLIINKINIFLHFKFKPQFLHEKGFVIVIFPFFKKQNCKQKFVHSLYVALMMRY